MARKGVDLDTAALVALHGILQSPENLKAVLAEYKQDGSTDEDALAHASYDIAEAMHTMSRVRHALLDDDDTPGE